MSREETIAVVESFFHCILSGDVTHLPVHPDFTTESPLSGKRQGQSALEYTKALGESAKAFELRQHIVEGEWVATLLEEELSGGWLPIFACFRIENGLIRSVLVFYDSELLARVS